MRFFPGPKSSIRREPPVHIPVWFWLQSLPGHNFLYMYTSNTINTCTKNTFIWWFTFHPYTSTTYLSISSNNPWSYLNISSNFLLAALWFLDGILSSTTKSDLLLLKGVDVDLDAKSTLIHSIYIRTHSGWP